MTDPYDRLVALRPEVPDEHDWANSEAGLAVLRRVQTAGQRRRPWWQRRRFVVPAIVIGLGAAVGTGVAFAPASRPPAAGGVICLDHTSDGAPSLGQTTVPPHAPHAEIVAACNLQYSQAHHTAPTDFAVCVFPPDRNQSGGAATAVPSHVVVTTANAASICQAAGYEPID